MPRLDSCLDTLRLLSCILYWLFLVPQIVIGAISYEDCNGISVYLFIHGICQFILLIVVVVTACYGFESRTFLVFIVLLMDTVLECGWNAWGIWLQANATCTGSNSWYPAFMDVALLINCIATVCLMVATGFSVDTIYRKNNRYSDDNVDIVE